jgi:hypothetical protein
VRSERFPLTVDLYMVDPEGREVGGSRGTVLVEDVLNGTRFDTLEVSTPPSYVGFVLRLRVEARDGTNATVLAATLSEQGLPSGACSGEALTTACIEQAGGFASDYPDAFLEVRRPELRLEEAAFETLQGQPSPVLYGPEEARASVVLESLAAIPFNGTVTVAALDSWSLAVGGSVRSANASLGRGQRARFGSAPFPAAPPNAYTILVQARDSAGREWAVTPTASGLVGVEAFPLSRLEARERGLVQGESVYIDQTIEHSGCRVRVSCEDCLPTCTLWLDRRACTVRADPGTCACECVAEAG